MDAPIQPDTSAGKRQRSGAIRRFFPLIDSLQAYDRSAFLTDLNAGLLVGVILIPQGMAYAELAGVPAIYGLYTALFPVLIYAFLGSSRHLSIGPVAISSLLLFAGVSQLATPGSAEYVGLVITCGFLVGALQFLIRVTRLGFLASFLSYPVITGFTSAAAVIIILSQVKSIFGLAISSTAGFREASQYFFEHLADINLVTLALSLGSLLLLLGLGKWFPKVPGALLVVIGSIALCYGAQLDTLGVAIIGTIPSGIPAFSLPPLGLQSVRELGPTLVTLTLMGVVECISIGRSIADQQRTYEIDANQELIAIGMSKMVGGFFAAIPSSGSFSRSSINATAGARSQLSTLVAALLVLLTLLFLTPLFYYLPKAILATIIILSVFKLIAVQEAYKLWQSHRSDFWMLLITFGSTLLLGIVTGVFLGVILSLAMVLYRISTPHVAVLGRVPGKTYYRNIERFDSVIEVADHLIVRFDQQLYFGNADFFKDRIRHLIKQHKAPLHAVFLDAQGINAIDSSGMRSLLDLNRDLTERGIHFYICNPIGPIRDRIKIHNEKYPNEALTLSMFLHDAVMQEINGG